MSEGDDRIHGYSPNATIFYDCAFPLSTNKTGDNDLPSAAQPPYRDEITLPTSPLPISQRTGDTLSLRAGENLNVKKKMEKKQLNSRYRGVRSAASVCSFECFQLVGRAYL